MLLVLPTIVMFTMPATIGHDFRKSPLKQGCRKAYAKLVYRFFCTIQCVLAGMRTYKVNQDCDYSYYLGPNYK